MAELYRVLKPNGYLLLREPTVSMGDWRKPRRGLTKRERGIPVDILKGIISSNGFRVLVEKRCDFSLTSRLGFLSSEQVYNSYVIVRIDKALCSLFKWNKKYHATNLFHKLRPTSIFYVLTVPCK